MPTPQPELAIPDCPLFVTERGPHDAPAVLLLHGICASTRYWTERMELLARDYHCYIPDLLGHGRSPKPDDIAYNLEDQTNALAPLLRFIAASHERPIPLICHSMGNLAGLELKRRHPDQVGIHLATAIPYFPTIEDGHAMVRSLSPVAQLTISDPWWATHVMDLARTTQGKLGYEWFHWAYGLPRDCWEDGFAVTWRSLTGSLHNMILGTNLTELLEAAGTQGLEWWHGTADASVPYRHAMALHAHFPGIPLHVIPEGTHNPWVFQNRELQETFAARLERYYRDTT